MAKDLLFSLTRDDFEIDTFRGTGPGGQKRNKTDSAVRIRHKESGAMGFSQTDRSQYVNKKLAFQRLLQTPTFKKWFNSLINEKLCGLTIEEKVDKMMSGENIQYSIRIDNKWEVVDEIEKDV